MKALSGKELARLVERHGWQLLRAQRSPHVYGDPRSIVRLSIPIHRNKIPKIHLPKLEKPQDRRAGPALQHYCTSRRMLRNFSFCSASVEAIGE